MGSVLGLCPDRVSLFIKESVVVITLGPHLWLPTIVYMCVSVGGWGACMRACVMCICMLHPKQSPPQAEATTEGAQMCCWLEAEVGSTLRSDTAHMAYGSNSKI